MRASRPHVLYELLNGSSTPQNSQNDTMMTTVDMEEQPEIESNEPYLQECNIAVLGSSKVGKTSLLKQLINNTFSETYEPTTRCHIYRKAVFVDGGFIYELILRDCPSVTYFPLDSLAEWSDYRGYGLLKSQVFVLVYDPNDEGTFTYVKSMRDQIMSVRGNSALMIVVGCKHDLADPGMVLSRHQQHQLVKKWKVPIVSCSPKYNWGIQRLCAEIIRLLEIERDSTKQTSNGRNNRWLIGNCIIA